MCDPEPVTLTYDDTGNADIHLGETTIGFIEGTFDTIYYMEIQYLHRGNGYGTNAIEQYLQKAGRIGVARVETTAVVDHGMQRIVDKLGFEPCEHDPTHYEIVLNNDSKTNP